MSASASGAVGIGAVACYGCCFPGEEPAQILSMPLCSAPASGVSAGSEPSAIPQRIHCVLRRPALPSLTVPQECPHSQPRRRQSKDSMPESRNLETAICWPWHEHTCTAHVDRCGALDAASAVDISDPFTGLALPCAWDPAASQSTRVDSARTICTGKPHMDVSDTSTTRNPASSTASQAKIGRQST
jgi:hypothetical protein